MRLVSLEMYNIRSHESTKIEFPTGTMLFRGDMGSGKSTILMAVEFALFGLGGIRADALLTRGRQKGEVVLEFEADGRLYEVGRTLISKDGKSQQDSKNTYAREGGETLPLAPTELKAYVMQKLKFREPTSPRAVSRVYRYAVYTPQEEIKSILYGKDREDTIRRAFGMDDYKTASTNAGTVISYLRTHAARLEGRFARLGEYESDLQSKKNELEEVGSTLKDLAGQERDRAERHERLKSDADALKRQLDELDVLEESKRQLKAAVADRIESVNKLERWIAMDRRGLRDAENAIRECSSVSRPAEMRLSEVDERLASAQKRDRALHAKRHRLAGCRGEIQEARGSLGDANESRIKDRMDGLRVRIADLESRQREAEESAEEKTAKRGGLNNEIRGLKDALARAESLGARCEYCDQPISGEYVERLLHSRQDRLAGAEEDMMFLKDSLNDIRSNVRSFQNSIKADREQLAKQEGRLKDARRLARLERELAALDSDISDLESGHVIESQAAFPRQPGEADPDYLMRLRDALMEYRDADRRRAQAEERRSELLGKIAEHEKQRESDRTRMGKLQEEVSEMSERLAGRESLASEYGAAVERLDAAAAELNETRNRSAAMRERRANITAETSRLAGEIREARRHRDVHSKYEDHTEWLKMYFVPSLSAIERGVLLDIQQTFDDHYREWYSILVDDPTKTSRIDDRFGPILEQGGYDQPVDNLSGGEKTSVALAYRLALNGTIREKMNVLDSNLLILDEPTDGFSREQMGKVHTVLGSLDAEQIIMVSHEAQLEGYVEHVFRVSKSGGVTSVQQVESG